MVRRSKNRSRFITPRVTKVIFDHILTFTDAKDVCRMAPINKHTHKVARLNFIEPCRNEITERWNQIARTIGPLCKANQISHQDDCRHSIKKTFNLVAISFFLGFNIECFLFSAFSDYNKWSFS